MLVCFRPVDGCRPHNNISNSQQFEPHDESCLRYEFCQTNPIDHFFLFHNFSIAQFFMKLGYLSWRLWTPIVQWCWSIFLFVNLLIYT